MFPYQNTAVHRCYMWFYRPFSWTCSLSLKLSATSYISQYKCNSVINHNQRLILHIIYTIFELFRLLCTRPLRVDRS